MDEKVENILGGRKAFFIVPDSTILPENYLEDYMAHGYECYIINEDHVCSLEKKIEIILSVFKDIILFFYIDAQIKGIDWPVFIKYLHEKYGSTSLLGVLYQKRKTEMEKFGLEKYYLYDVGIQCGCIAMEFQKSKNFSLIEKVLFENQAAGRRKNIRAICDSGSKLSFEYEGHYYTGRIKDVSLSHFSCAIDTHPFTMPVYTKVQQMMLIIQGIHFRTNAVLFLERQSLSEKLYVFIFVRSDGSKGLDTDIQTRLLPKIYEIITNDGKKLLNGLFETYGRRIRDAASAVEK